MSFPVTIYHNPRCGKSRETLALVREAGHEPEVVLYLETGWTAVLLKRLLKAMGKRPRDILRAKETEAAGLDGASDSKVLAAMVEYPILVERPIVETPKGVRLGRPPEAVKEVL